MSIDEWKRAIGERETRDSQDIWLRRIQNGDAETYAREYARSQASAATSRLQTFVGGDEYAFIRAELAKHPYDHVKLSRSYSLSIPTNDFSGQGAIDWPRSVLVLLTGRFTGPHRSAREFHAMTSTGLTSLRHRYGLWNGPGLRGHPIASADLIEFAATNLFGAHGPHAASSRWNYLFHKPGARNWDEWTHAAREGVDSWLDLSSQIRGQFSLFVRS